MILLILPLIIYIYIFQYLRAFRQRRSFGIKTFSEHIKTKNLSMSFLGMLKVRVNNWLKKCKQIYICVYMNYMHDCIANHYTCISYTYTPCHLRPHTGHIHPEPSEIWRILVWYKQTHRDGCNYDNITLPTII